MRKNKLRVPMTDVVANYRDLLAREMRGPSDAEGAMHRIQTKYGIDFNSQWALRYRPPVWRSQARPRGPDGTCLAEGNTPMKPEYPRGRAPKTNISWTPSMDAEIIRLWNAGKITREISALIPGTTRNAILGRLHRLRINGADIEARVPSRRNFLAGKTPKPRVRATTLPAKSKSPSVAFPESRKRPPKFRKVLPKQKDIPTGKLCSIVDLTGCKYPVSEGEKVVGKYLFCNAEKSDSVPYCDHHLAVTWKAVTWQSNPS